MTDDIVTRLREQVCECGYSASFDELHKCVWCEAADEIERLRKELHLANNSRLHATTKETAQLLLAMKNEVELLRKELNNATAEIQRLSQIAKY